MNIGILTLPLHTNYGGILQAYALQTILEREGHHVEIIDVDTPSTNWELMYWRYIKRLVKKIIFRRKVYIFLERKDKVDQKIVRTYTDKFISKYIHKRVFKSLSDIKSSDFAAIVVGSDQIWRKKYFTEAVSKNIENEFLAFTDTWNLRRIAYAPSFSIDYWEYTKAETLEMAKYAKKFDAISVREDSGVRLCKEMLGVEAEHVLDPTMLLDKSDYIKLIEEAGITKSKGNLFAYILDSTPEKLDLLNQVATDKKLVPFEVHNPKVNDVNSKIEERIQPAVEVWLRAFYDAEFVVTDSFHACVFSIIFNKPFIVVGNAKRGMARFYSLLKIFNLENHLFKNSKDYSNLKDYSIDENSKKILDELRGLSLTFLNSALSLH